MSKISTKFKKMTTKFLLALQFCKNAAHTIIFVLKTLILALMLLRLFLKGEGTNKKSENMWSSSFIRGTKNPKEVWVCVAAFWHKIGTTPLGYFLLVALYYC